MPLVTSNGINWNFIYPKLKEGNLNEMWCFFYYLKVNYGSNFSN